ncbi:peptidoglycan-binding protein [Candidatus Woesearchaeota archaeon]|nr:peptidoglycan-binding protein [Candidatus Woesearchaeota archaeon]
MSNNLSSFKRMLIVAGATAALIGGAYFYGRLSNSDNKQYDINDYMTAVAQIESNGNPIAKRYEPKINDVSYGEHQILTRTALYLEKKHPGLPRISDYGDLESKIRKVNVEEAEKDLIELYSKKVSFNGNIKEVNVDGEIDVASRELIKRIQRKHGLDVTGKLDRNTLIAIKKDRHVEDRLLDPEINNAYAEFLFKREFDFYGGNKDLAVAAYNSGHFTPLTARTQEQLNDLYGTGLVPDGIVGNETSSILKRFQKEFRLNETGRLTENGNLDARTYGKIQEEWRKKFPNSPNPKGIVPEIRITKRHVKRFNAALRKGLF